MRTRTHPMSRSRVAGFLGLDRRDRMDGVGAANRLRRCLRQPEEPDLSLLHQGVERAKRLFERGHGIVAMNLV